MSKTEPAGDLFPGQLPIHDGQSGGSVAALLASATVESSYESDSEAFGDHCSYEDAFEAECLLRNRGGLRDFSEERDRRLAEHGRRVEEIRSRGLGIPFPHDYEFLLSWIDDRRERSVNKQERATLARVSRALTLTIEGAMFADACQEAGTSRRTVEKYLWVYRECAVAWFRTCQRRERDRARRERRGKRS